MNIIEVQKIEKSKIEIENRPEAVKTAETLGKFSEMCAKNGVGDKSGIYGH